MQHLLSKSVGFLANRRMGGVTHWAIKKYCAHFNVSLDEALLTDIKQYRTFNEFFTRQLKEGARPVTPDEHIITSPADGLIVQSGKLTDAQWHIKGQHYPLDELLTSEDLCLRYQNGYSVNIYLSPRDYHRVHMPYDGILQQTIYIKGKLYSVNPNHKHAKFINKNERLICEFQDPVIGNFIVMFIGALNVGSIHTVWQSCFNKGRDLNHNTIKLKKGMELGHFQMGSSILLITEHPYLPADKAIVDSSIKMGAPLLSTETHYG